MSHRRHRRRRGGGLPPIFLLPVALIIGLIVLAVVFGGVVSVLGGLAMTGLVCFAPLVLIGVVIAAILKDQQQKAGSSTATDAWTQPRQTAKTPGATANSASESATPALPTAARTAAPPPVQPLDQYPDKGGQPAGDYRKRAADYRKQIQGHHQKSPLRAPGRPPERRFAETDQLGGACESACGSADDLRARQHHPPRFQGSARPHQPAAKAGVPRDRSGDATSRSSARRPLTRSSTGNWKRWRARCAARA